MKAVRFFSEAEKKILQALALCFITGEVMFVLFSVASGSSLGWSLSASGLFSNGIFMVAIEIIMLASAYFIARRFRYAHTEVAWLSFWLGNAVLLGGIIRLRYEQSVNHTGSEGLGIILFAPLAFATTLVAVLIGCWILKQRGVKPKR